MGLISETLKKKLSTRLEWTTKWANYTKMLEMQSENVKAKEQMKCL